MIRSMPIRTGSRQRYDPGFGISSRPEVAFAEWHDSLQAFGLGGLDKPLGKRAGLSADSHISSGVRGQGIGQAPDRQTARHRCGRLTFVVRPELEWLAFGFRGKDLGGCDMDGIERANVNGKRTPGLVDDAGVDSCKVQRQEQISQLLPLDGGFGIVKVSDETFAINRAERFDFNELRKTTRSPATSRKDGPGSENTTRSTALASTYFTGIFTHRAE
jgi:hypothetical protein